MKQNVHLLHLPKGSEQTTQQHQKCTVNKLNPHKTNLKHSKYVKPTYFNKA